MQPESKGKYVLVGPTATGFDWWMINDLEKMYAVVTVQVSFPDAEKIIRNAWDALE